MARLQSCDFELAFAPERAVRGLARAQAMWAERLVALALLAAALPVLLASALVVALLSRRCPLIAHARVGQCGRRIWVLKLRTMWRRRARVSPRALFSVERIESPPAAHKMAVDPRVTSRFAAFCRKHSIDELPQLWHVVKGEMSLVGPRPMTRDELAQWYGADAVEVLRAKPGLTGLWQVNGRSSLSYRQRRRLDLFLVRKWSARLYLAILLYTVPSVLSGKNAA